MLNKQTSIAKLHDVKKQTQIDKNVKRQSLAKQTNIQVKQVG